MLARRISISLLGTLLTVVLAACGGDTPETSSLPIDASYAPKASADAALEAMLAAEKDVNRTESFKLLAPEARTQFSRVELWTERRNELGPITAFDVKEGDGNNGKAIAEVEHQPVLDPFRGLVAAKERQTWTGVKVTGGWLLQPEPFIEPEYPNESGAADAAKSWVEAVQSCDPAKADQLQGVKDLFTTGGPTLCRMPGAVTTGEIGQLPDGTVTKLITDQYGVDALIWARVVKITAPTAVSVVMAPIGDDWKVIGLIAG